MRKIIGDLMYDTDKATYIARKKVCIEGRYRCRYEELYKTNNGRWFIHSYNHDFEKTEEAVDKSDPKWEPNIFPVKEDDVIGWLSKHVFIKELKTHFNIELKEA